MKMKQELQLFNRMEKEVNFFNSKYEKIQDKYGNKFVAILDNEVIASASRVEVLFKKLKKQNKDITLVLIEYIPKKGTAIIL